MKEIQLLPTRVKHNLIRLFATGIIGWNSEALMGYRIMSAIHALRVTVLSLVSSSAGRKKDFQEFREIFPDHADISDFERGDLEAKYGELDNLTLSTLRMKNKFKT